MIYYSTEDQQNEHLRRIHTFQASSDNIEKNNLIKKGTLPTFDIFLSEGYQEFIDEDTGEIVTMWVEDPDPEEEKRKRIYYKT